LKATGLFHNFFALFYPHSCHSCGESLVSNEDCICTTCKIKLPFTFYSKEKENKLTQFFWGRMPVESGAALLYFQKGGNVQHLIHQFKYKGYQEIGNLLGLMLGAELKESQYYQGLDVVVPVPLHPAKMKTRGFNQSEVFGGGLAEALGIKQVSDGLVRVISTSTQTKKTRFKRWENVKTVFEINNPNQFENKNILLVDDVVTTGATLEACANMLLQIKGTKLWLATIAVTT